MNKRLQRHAGREALDLVEEAVNLVRAAPRGVLACYYIGALPFLLGLLNFFADMSRGAFADEHLAGGSLGVGLLFWWMKCWHAVFACGLRARLADEPAPRWTPARVARLALVQLAIQPSGLVVRPVAMLITIPYGWVRAFYHSVTALGDGTTGDAGAVARSAWRQATLWPRQNHLALLILFGFGVFVWLNVTVAIIAVPQLLKMFTGIETRFTMSWGALLNSTFLATTGAGAYLCLNPVTTALYTLRCFYGESLETGEDLRTSLKKFTHAAARATAIAALIFSGLCETGRAGDTASKPARAATSQPIGSAALDRSLGEVLDRPEFAWRMPREKSPDRKGLFAGFFESAFGKVKAWLKPVVRWLNKKIGEIIDWLFQRDSDRDQPPKGFRGLTAMRVSIYAVIALAAGLVVWFSWKAWRNRRSRAKVAATPLAAMPDLASEEITAAQLPEDGWLRLAREMTERGELRLALRALYLAGLAHLGARDLIAIARYKSNLDYERELRRRARDRAQLLDAFGESVTVFDRAWYGMHAVTHETIHAFTANLERIRAC